MNKTQKQILNCTTADKWSDRKMNSETYKLRRRVMKFIYQAKALVPDLPRVEVRISDMKNCAGRGWYNQNVIRIDAKHTEVISSVKLKRIVYHEIGHAVFGLKHDSKCPVMESGWTLGFTNDLLDKTLLKWSKK